MPLAELGYGRFWQRLIAIEDFGRLIVERRVLTVSGPYIHAAHNQLVREALKDDVPPWKRLLFLEHDHGFPPDVFQRHAEYTQPVVAGHYVQRLLSEPLPVIYMWDDRRANALRPPPLEMKRMLDERGTYEVDVVPMGCTSIRRDVLENWPAGVPMFTAPTNPDTGATMSDDVWFCRKAQDQGYSIFVDTSLSPSHFVLHEMDDKYFIAWWAKQQNGRKAS